MFKLEIQTKAESWDSINQEFIAPESITVELEHSLVSLSKWEAIWEKPFLGPDKKTTEESLGYIYAMCLTPDVPPEVFQRMTDKHLTLVNNYIDAKMTATWFNEHASANGPKKKEIITAELIYYWMVTFNIPFETQTWHLNRLITLIKICNAKNAPEKTKKTNPKDLSAQRNLLNQQRMAKLGTNG